MNIQLDQVMARKLRVSAVPCVVGLVAGRLSWYLEEPFSLEGLRQFLRDLFPSDLLLEVRNQT